MLVVWALFAFGLLAMLLGVSIITTGGDTDLNEYLLLAAGASVVVAFALYIRQLRAQRKARVSPDR